MSPTAKVPLPPTTSVLIDAARILTHFPLPVNRDAVLRPLKLAGLLGAYNVFVLVHGGDAREWQVEGEGRRGKRRS